MATGSEVADGDEGLLYISGRRCSSGYWNRPVENSKAFLERDGMRWYNTGDVVRWDPADGFIYVGRRDRMVKRRGYRIELGEIERGLYLHPQVREAAVIVDARRRRRREDRRVPVVSRRRSAVDHRDEDVLRVEAAGLHEPGSVRLPRALPRTSTDKVDYQSLEAAGRLSGRAMQASPSPRRHARRDSQAHKAQTPEAVVRIWSGSPAPLAMSLPAGAHFGLENKAFLPRWL